jgi:hypothetical protein
MTRSPSFSSPVFEVVSAAFGQALGELVALVGSEADIAAALDHAGETARETLEALSEAHAHTGECDGAL